MLSGGRLRARAALHADDGWNFVQHFRDADDGDFVIIGNQLDARLGHSRTAHSEKMRAGAFAQGEGQACGVHVAGSFPGRDQNLRRRHASAPRQSSADNGWGGCGNPGIAPSVTGTPSSCSLYCSW